MPFIYEINGQDIEFDKEPTEADIDEAVAQLGGQQFTTAQFPKTQRTGGDLGLSFLEKAGLRGRLAFGDDPEFVKDFLQQRFPGREVTQLEGRKFALDGIPIDPGQFSVPEALLDVIDISDELIRLGGQIGGGIAGTAGGPLGVIGGGATGRAGAQGIVEIAGRALGVQGGEELTEVAKDIAREGAIGAIGEAFGLGLRAISKPTGKLLRTLWKNIARKGRSAEQVIINFTSGAERESIKHLQRAGTRVLNDANLSDDALLRVGQKIQTAAIKARNKFGDAVRTGKGVVRDISKKSIDISDIRNDFGIKLQEVGLIGRNFQTLRPEIGKLDIGQKQLIDIFKLLQKNKKISPARALRWREQLDRIIKFNQAGKITLTGGEDALAKGFREQLKQKLITVSDDFAKANADFEAFAGIAEILKGKLDDKTVENFLKSTFSGQHIFEENLKRLNKVVSVEDTFMPQLRDVLAARSFAKTTFSGIRTGIFSGLLGSLGLAGAGPTGVIPAVGAGIILSTPRLAGKAVLRRQASSRLLQSLLQKGAQKAQPAVPKVGASLLNRLLQR